MSILSAYRMMLEVEESLNTLCVSSQANMQGKHWEYLEGRGDQGDYGLFFFKTPEGRQTFRVNVKIWKDAAMLDTSASAVSDTPIFAPDQRKSVALKSAEEVQALVKMMAQVLVDIAPLTVQSVLEEFMKGELVSTARPLEPKKIGRPKKAKEPKEPKNNE